MKNISISLIFCSLVCILSCRRETGEWIRINQLGYRNDEIKTAVFLSVKSLDLKSFKLIDEKSGKVVMTFDKVIKAESLDPFKSCYRLPFTNLKQTGVYRIIAGNAESPEFPIGENVYDGTADFLLNYMRQQRSGYNPYVKDSCHTHDGYEIYGKSIDSAHINVSGGWHDAADYLQYVATSANATYQMLFAYSENPGSFGDKYSANGLQGPDNIPDILDECKWGLD
ncbi:MAG TPA: glycoside hydrolase family 9 protein, partial [Bacteroidales bacterium]|nr:glycoside hydrolase family 9 protein [Bacteroidales bacterium]